MTGPRFRRHTDGRVARWIDDGPYSRWHIWNVDGSFPIGHVPDDPERDEGWSEAVLVELPEPDGSTDESGEQIPYWTLGNGDWLHAGDAYDVLYELDGEDASDALTYDAVRMLAAARWEVPQ